MAAARSASAWRAQGAGTLHLGCDPLGNLTVALTVPGQTQPVLSGRLLDWPVLPTTVTQLEIHSLAGFIRPDEAADWLIAAAQGALAVTLFWHEHYLICPTRHLLDPEHRYCGVPEVADCARCLPDNPNCSRCPVKANRYRIVAAALGPVAEWHIGHSGVLCLERQTGRARLARARGQSAPPAPRGEPVTSVERRIHNPKRPCMSV